MHACRTHASCYPAWITILDGEAALRFSRRSRSLPCRSSSEGLGSFGGFTLVSRLANQEKARVKELTGKRWQKENQPHGTNAAGGSGCQRHLGFVIFNCKKHAASECGKCRGFWCVFVFRMCVLASVALVSHCRRIPFVSQNAAKAW